MADNPYEDLIQNPRAETAPASTPQITVRPQSSNPYEDLVTQGPQPPQPKVRQPNEPFGELRPAEYNWRETIGNKAQDALIALGAKPYVAGRVGRGAVDAASLIPPIGATISGLDTGYYANRGDPLMAGVNALGVIPGATAARRAVGGMPQRVLAPEEEQLGRATTQAYNAWRNSPVRYDPSMMDDATNQIAQVLAQRGSNPVSAPKQFAALEAGQNLKTQTGMTNQHFETLRQQLRGGRDRSEIAAGEAAADALEQYMTNPTNLLRHHRSGSLQDIYTARENLLTGRGNAAANFRSDVITGKEQIADIAEERGRDFGKTFRDRMGTLSSGTPAAERALRGFNEAERQAVRNEVAGSLAERAAGGAGRAITAASPYAGAVVTGSTGAAGALGKAFGLDPVTAAAAGAMMYGGGQVAGRNLSGHATNLARRSADELSAGLRMRSPEAQAPGSPYGYVTDPIAMRNDAAKYLGYPWLRQQGEQAVEEMRTPFQYR